MSVAEENLEILGRLQRAQSDLYEARQLNTELVAALKAIYLTLLNHPGDTWRTEHQYAYCLLRDQIALATGQSSEDVQNSCEETALLRCGNVTKAGVK